MPMRSMGLAPIAGNETERAIPGALLGGALFRVAPAAASAGMGVDHVAGLEHNARLLGRNLPVGKARRLQPVSVRPAVLAAEQATGAVPDAIARRIADGR